MRDNCQAYVTGQPGMGQAAEERATRIGPYMCFARVRPASIGRKAGGVLLTTAAGFVVTAAMAQQALASPPGGGSGVVSGSVNSAPTIWQCEALTGTSTSTPPPTTPPPTTPPPTSTPSGSTSPSPTISGS